MTSPVGNPKERVWTALQHGTPDPLPRGEILVEEAFLDRIYPEMVRAPYGEKMAALAEAKGLDVVTVRLDGKVGELGLRDLNQWVRNTSYFIMALVDGLFWKPEDPVPFDRFVVGMVQGERGVLELIRKKMSSTLDLIRQCLDRGADGIIIGDDLAWDRGPFASPKDLQDTLGPGFRELTAAVRREKKAVFLHSCGNLTRMVDLIQSWGFHGLHGLATTAGNDPLAIRRATRHRLVLMGAFDLDGLQWQQIKAMKEEIMKPLAQEGGYILGSAAGLSSNTPIEGFRALYR
jgi:uroporphyrinogen decarboxylase